MIADATLLRHALDNLIGNAIKYPPAGTTPEVEIRAHTLAGGITRVEVADRGIGIPATEQPKIFYAARTPHLRPAARRPRGRRPRPCRR